MRMAKYLSPVRLAIGAGNRASRFRERRANDSRRAEAKSWLDRSALRPFKVNVGCGQVPFDGWVNLDLDPGTKADFLWDVTNGLPFEEGTCAFIYSEHFLEHLPVQQGARFLGECHRSLGNGGVLRIGMPSLQEIVRQYHENDWSTQPWLAKYGYAWIKNRAEFININFREWGHQWLYDEEELRRRLGEAGFHHIINSTLGESQHPELRNRETRNETLLICEATK